MEYIGFFIYKNYIDNSYGILDMEHTYTDSIFDCNLHFDSVDSAKQYISDFLDVELILVLLPNISITHFKRGMKINVSDWSKTPARREFILNVCRNCSEGKFNEDACYYVYCYEDNYSGYYLMIKVVDYELPFTSYMHLKCDCINENLEGFSYSHLISYYDRLNNDIQERDELMDYLNNVEYHKELEEEDYKCSVGLEYYEYLHNLGKYSPSYYDEDECEIVYDSLIDEYHSEFEQMQSDIESMEDNDIQEGLSYMNNHQRARAYGDYIIDNEKWELLSCGLTDYCREYIYDRLHAMSVAEAKVSNN